MNKLILSIIALTTTTAVSLGQLTTNGNTVSLHGFGDLTFTGDAPDNPDAAWVTRNFDGVYTNLGGDYHNYFKNANNDVIVVANGDNGPIWELRAWATGAWNDEGEANPTNPVTATLISGDQNGYVSQEQCLSPNFNPSQIAGWGVTGAWTLGNPPPATGGIIFDQAEQLNIGLTFQNGQWAPQ